MTFESIRQAVWGRMATWTGAPIAYDGQPPSQAVLDAQANKTPWVRLSINHGTSTAPYKGSEPGIRRTGLVFVQIFTALNAGTRPANETADSIASHLQFYRSGGIELLTASVQRVGPDGDYYQYNVSVPFRSG